MLRPLFLMTLTFIGLANPVLAEPEGVISVKTDKSVSKAADDLEAVLINKGMKQFNRIKHSAGAQKVGVTLRPTELVIFGNPKVGSPLMKCAQTVALDLPQKALIWQDESGQTRITVNDPEYLGKRHNMQACKPMLKKIANALKGIIGAAASGDTLKTSSVN